MTTTDPIFDIFREEARDHLGALERAFLDLEGPGDVEARRALIHSLFRHAHTLKSDAKVVGLGQLKEASQLLEDLLDAMRASPAALTKEAVERGLAQLDEVRRAFEAWEGAGVPGEVSTRKEASPPPPSAAAEARAALVAPPPAGEESFTVRVPADRLDRMLSLAGEVRIAQRSSALAAEGLADLREHLKTLYRLAGSASGTELQQALEGAVDQASRLETSLRRKLSREDLLSEALQGEIHQARLLPLVMLTDSLRRAVRDLAQSLGKGIRYEAEVGQILLDKAVIEAIRDPLLHLLRNAADHGIETPAGRRAAGKPEEGVISIRASQRGQMVRMLVSDDGRGVDYEEVRRRVRQMGGLSEAELGELGEEELARYLFQPGFSTASPGEISGRGVGLDVVAEAARRLQGQARLEKSSAAGATFALAIPVAVSTLRVLTVRSGGQYYGIPSRDILEMGRARGADLRQLEGSLVLPLGDDTACWTQLADLLGLASSGQPRSEAPRPYLLLSQHGRSVAVAVDELGDEGEVLLKPLGYPLRDLPGIVGAAVREDGSIQVIIDLMGVAFSGARALPSRPEPGGKPAARILVVDDSPTTRAVLRNLLTAAGYTVRTATDGLDALERLRGQRVDLVVSDVEMPRMNGFDLTRRIKAGPGLPVILVTGKEEEEHRLEGLAAGADAYVVKSTFQGEGLLDIIQQLV